MPRAAALACRATFLLAIFSLASGCVSSCSLRRVKDYRSALSRHDEAAVRRYLAPGATLWFEKKEGAGEPLGTGGGRWRHWDEFFHGRSDMTEWKAWGREVSATAHETNDLYRLLEWEPAPYRIIWWLDGADRIREVLIKSIPHPPTKGRLPAFKAWAKEHRPEELAYLMPDDQFDPTADRAERFRALLIEWRAAAGLARIELRKDVHRGFAGEYAFAVKRLTPRRRAVPSMPGGLSSLAGFVLAVGAVGLLSCSEHRGPTAPGPEKEVSFQTVYAGGSGIAAFETVAIRNDAQWRQFWTRVQEGGSPASPLPSVDFRSSMLLAAAMVGDGCSSIEITDVTIDRLSLRVTVHHQDHGCACPAVIEKIVHIVRIPRYSQPVDWFVPPPVQLPCAQGR